MFCRTCRSEIFSIGLPKHILRRSKETLLYSFHDFHILHILFHTDNHLVKNHGDWNMYWRVLALFVYLCYLQRPKMKFLSSSLSITLLQQLFVESRTASHIIDCLIDIWKMSFSSKQCCSTHGHHVGYQKHNEVSLNFEDASMSGRCFLISIPWKDTSFH